MWETYRGGDEPTQPEQPEATGPSEQPEPMKITLYPPTSTPRGSDFPNRSAKGPGAGAGAAVAAVIAVIALGVGLDAGSEGTAESDHQDWYDCIASYAYQEPGLLTPADLCEIGHERPPGYTDYDDYDWSPEDDYDSWTQVP